MYMSEHFQEYSLIQYFEAEFPLFTECHSQNTRVHTRQGNVREI